MVRAGPPGVEASREHLEGSLLRRFYHERPLYRGIRRLHRLSSFLGCRLEGVQRLIPIAVELVPQGANPIGLDLVDPPSPFGPVGNQPGQFQHPEVLGDGRPADRQVPGQVADRGWRLRQPVEDRPPGVVAECVKAVHRLSGYVRLHLP